MAVYLVILRFCTDSEEIDTIHYMFACRLIAGVVGIRVSPLAVYARGLHMSSALLKGAKRGGGNGGGGGPQYVRGRPQKTIKKNSSGDGSGGGSSGDRGGSAGGKRQWRGAGVDAGGQQQGNSRGFVYSKSNSNNIKTKNNSTTPFRKSKLTTSTTSPPARVPVTGWLSYNDVCSQQEAKRYLRAGYVLRVYASL